MHITQEEFAKRRKTFLSYMRKKSVAIIPSAKVVYRNGDSTYPFRQDSDFWYLTGFNEPDAIAVFHTLHGEGEYCLFSRARHPEKEIWEGKIAGQALAVTEYGADSAYPIETFPEKLLSFLEESEFLYYTFDQDKPLDNQIFEVFKKIRSKGRSGYDIVGCIFSVDVLLHEMRLIKSEAELAAMRLAANITVDAHRRAMQFAKAGMYEYQLEAQMAAEILNQGSRGFAYQPIIAAGRNACILHYVENQSQIQPSDLVLMDVGAEYQYYAADVTRTFPISGRFTAEQRAIYELVLAAQQAVIQALRPELPWNAMQKIVIDVLVSGLLDLGLLKGNKDAIIESKAYGQFYMHSSGHWLGLDTHDVGRYKLLDEWRKLREGMVLTVEPGIYISPDNFNVDERWRGIGVRIEDDVLISEKGADVLSGHLPKSVEEIEALCRAK